MRLTLFPWHLFAIVLLAWHAQLQAQELSLDMGSSLAESPAQRTFSVSIEGASKLFPGLTAGHFIRNGQMIKFGGPFVGLRYPTRPERWYAEINLGAVYISPITDRLGTQFQFRLATFAGWRSKHWGMRYGYVHFSNGSRFLQFLGVHGPNHGENFLTCGNEWYF